MKKDNPQSQKARKQKVSVYLINPYNNNIDEEFDHAEFKTLTREQCEDLVTRRIARKLNLAEFEYEFNEYAISDEDYIRIFFD